MGMDVSGKNPKGKCGEYFRANVWSWRPIHTIIEEVAAPLFTKKQLESLGYNDGAGLELQSQCNDLANRIQTYLVDHQAKTFGFDTESGGYTHEYRVGREHLQQFVDFLRQCGGFEVW